MSLRNEAAHEKEMVARLADRYAADGYDVVVEPRGDALPVFLRDLAPDLVAHKGAEHIVIEVKGRAPAQAATQTRVLADRISRHPGWSFRLVLSGSDESDWRPPAKLPNKRALRDELATVDQLVASGSNGAALLLLWSIIEGASRHLLAERGTDVMARISPPALLKQLLFEGEIEDADYHRLRDTLAIRNSVAHGFLQQDIAPERIADLRMIALRLIKPQPQAA